MIHRIDFHSDAASSTLTPQFDSCSRFVVRQFLRSRHSFLVLVFAVDKSDTAADLTQRFQAPFTKDLSSHLCVPSHILRASQ